MRPGVGVLGATALLWTSAAAQIRQRFDLRVPMRDGVELSAALWTPEGPGPYPTVVVRTPYLKANEPDARRARKYAAAGYAVLLQDVRGRGDSDGEFRFLSGDGEDGYDTIEWAARQPWSNGRIGMVGGSYRAAATWQTARALPEHLVCMIPQSPLGDNFHDVPYVGGAFALRWSLAWTFGVSGRVQQNPFFERWPGYLELLRARPLLTLDERLGKRLPLYREWLSHDRFDDYWRRLTLTADDFRRIDLPVLTTSGWFDFLQAGTLRYWRGMRDHSPARDRQYLLIGPWLHNSAIWGGSNTVGDLTFPEVSKVDVDSLHLAFFDYCLERTSSRFAGPRARVYLTGSNTWRDLDDYPPREAEPRPLYLASGGRANGLSGDGRLVWSAPGDGPPDQYRYDPKEPVPSPGFEQAKDQTGNQRRDDVLVYTSAALNEPVEIIGPVDLVLHAASDARDTDFIVKLTDVHPDGRAYSLGPQTAGVIRARYRHGFDREELLTPGAVEEYTIGIGHVGHVFLAGHRIRIEITSSAAPWINPNQNTGNPVATDTEWKVAHQTIYHDRARPSRLVLPVMPDTASRR